MYLHLITDEKFIDHAIARFQRIDPGRHQFICLSNSNQVEFRYLKQTDQVSIIEWDSLACQQLLERLNQYTAVFVHSLISPYFVEVINRADSNVTFIWIFWGAELWMLKKFKTKAYLPLTKLLYYQHVLLYRLNKVKLIIRKYTRLLLKPTGPGRISDLREKWIQFASSFHAKNRDVIHAIKRVNYIIPVIKEDYDHLQKMIPCQAEYLDWNYSVGFPLSQLDDVPMDCQNILIGNSASYTNNHWEMFIKIKKHKSLFNKIIVPLSYGDPLYRQSILKKGQQILGNQFYPVIEFLPLETYYHLVSNCYLVFFNTIRQQAMGNIVVCLYSGAKVFLRRKNPIYQFLKRQNAVIFSIEDEMKIPLLQHPLSENERSRNKAVIRSLYNEEMMDRKTQKIISCLQEKTKECGGTGP